MVPEQLRTADCEPGTANGGAKDCDERNEAALGRMFVGGSVTHSRSRNVEGCVAAEVLHCITRKPGTPTDPPIPDLLKLRRKGPAFTDLRKMKLMVETTD